MLLFVVESSACDAAIVKDGWLQTLYVCLRNKHMHRAGKLAHDPCTYPSALGSRLGLCALRSYMAMGRLPQTSCTMRDRGRLHQHTSNS
jgi:hypothetical protein